MDDGPLVLGTAGHVDHGKTSLVLALTGRDTDRLAAEKARGISIELGFAPLALPSGRRVSLVDVPGHERFVRHMVAGTSGVDAYLLCVAADDGVMPQTREHLAVLGLLGVADGVVAVTRADLADPGAAAAHVRALVGDGPEVVPVSAPRGTGLPELRAALDRLAARVTSRRAEGPTRLFVDRAFSVAGAGTVVTGTLWGAPIARGDHVAVHPSGARARVRGVHVHDEPVERATGGRVALALAGLPRQAAPRGSCVVRADDPWTPTDRLGARLRWLDDAGGDLTGGRRLQLFLGTVEVPVACVPLDPARVAPGGEAWATLRPERPVLARTGDRVVLRSAERRTVGGAEVVDVHPPRRARRADRVARLAVLAGGTAEQRAALRLDDAGARGLDAAELDAPPAGAVALGGRIFAADIAARARAAVLRAVGRDGTPPARARAAAGLPAAATAELVDALTAEGAVAVRGRRLVPPGAGALDPDAERVARLLEQGGLRPPTPHQLAEDAGVPADALRAALGRLRMAGRVAPAGDLWFDAAALAGATARAREALAGRPLRVAELRDLWGVGRRGALALAAHLDATGVTVRRGDERILRGAGRGGG